MHSIVLKLSPLLLQLIASQNGPSESSETENPKAFQNSIMFEIMQKIKEEKGEEYDLVAMNSYGDEIEEEIYREYVDGINRQTRADPCISLQRDL